MSSIPPERLAELFVEVADTLVADFDTLEFLQMVSTRTAGLIEARDVGILLADAKGRLQLMAASDERAEMVELFQVQATEGPCQDCFTTAKPVINVDLARATSAWPRFAPMAVAAGYRSVHAFPLRLRRETIGAINLFSELPGQMTDADARVVQALADTATIGLLQQQAVQRSEVLASQLQHALDSRVVLEQAKGALAYRHGCTPDEAFTRMRTYARGGGRPLSEVARDVVTHADTVRDLLARPTVRPGPPGRG